MKGTDKTRETIGAGMRRVFLFLTLLSSLCVQSLSQVRPSYLPNSTLSPGDVREVTKNDLCDSKYRTFNGSLSVVVKRQVFEMYDIRPDSPIAYNVDHVIPISLGGSNAIKNLWPQPLSGEWNHPKKNELEHRMYKLVCSGELDLKKAQQEIAADWVSAYRKYVTDSEGKR